MAFSNAEIGKYSKRLMDEDSINVVIRRIVDGEVDLRDDLIYKYKPFIKKEVANYIKQFHDIENTDEFSIGLLAFNEAIDCYNEGKSNNFFKFCSLVIKRRLNDYLKSNIKSKYNTVPFTYFENEESRSFEDIYCSNSTSQYEAYEIISELRDLKIKLKGFGITMNDLVITAPKHRDSKRLCINIAKELAGNRDLFYKLDKKGTFPKSELLKLVRVNKNTLERNRKFIIAAALIIGNGYDLLRNYIELDDEGGD
ncbi:MAG: RNA polymerase subunit sigma [Clostridiaceae bacterium]|nr:RNA polymerase subunit sigma [Clostridiaceae bacterium]